MSYSMPPEWAPHDRTWMAFPTLGKSLEGADAAELLEVREAWVAVAHAVARFEPVTMLVDPADAETARGMVGEGITLVETPLDDAWMRDIGPTFVHAEDGSLAAVDWIFNGWGGQEWAAWGRDSLVARRIGELAGVPVVPSPMTMEGGAIHVDGDRTVLVTKTVQLDPGRNPGWTAEQVEDELRRTLGTTKVVWAERGLARDYERFGTRGHIDVLAVPVSPDVVLYHDQRDPEHPDFAVSAELRATLEAAGDWTLVPVPAPTVLRDEDGWVDYTYINHYVVNGGVILCGFADPNDEVAKAILEEAYPGREVVLVDARTIFANGGGIHCITQQQPSPRL